MTCTRCGWLGMCFMRVSDVDQSESIIASRDTYKMTPNKDSAVSYSSDRKYFLQMNFKYTQILYTLLIALLEISLATATSISSSVDDSMTTSTSTSVPDPTDQQLGDVYQKMGGVTDGMMMNLDSSFGGGRCNCVCEDN